jgi:hypothetical protein
MTGIGASTPPAQHQRLQHVVRHARQEQHHCVGDRPGLRIIAARPNVADGGQAHYQRRYLGDAEDQHDHRQRTPPRNTGDQQGQANNDGLGKSHADHSLGDGTNVAVVSVANSPPCAVPTMRSEIARLPRSPACPKAMMMPAMTRDAKKLQPSTPHAGDEA